MHNISFKQQSNLTKHLNIHEILYDEINIYLNQPH